MALATFSFESRLRRYLEAWPMSLDTFAALASLSGIRGASKSRLSTALGGQSLPNETTLALEALVMSIDLLVKAAHPLTLDSSSPGQFYGLLLAHDAGALVVSVKS